MPSLWIVIVLFLVLSKFMFTPSVSAKRRARSFIAPNSSQRVSITPSLSSLKLSKACCNANNKTFENTAGDMLSKKGGVWSPVRTYKNGLDSGVNETKISDEAERELEEELAMEKKSKKKKTSFANETNQLPAGSKRKAKKKLSLSKVGGNDQWLSKQSIENESQKSVPKVARAIPRVRKSNEGDAKKSSSDESSDEDETLADVSSRISPKKQLASKGGSKATKDTLISSTKKKTPARKGAVAKIPIRLTSGVESSSTDSPIKEVEDSSQPEESDSDVSSVVEGEDER